MKQISLEVCLQIVTLENPSPYNYARLKIYRYMCFLCIFNFFRSITPNFGKKE